MRHGLERAADPITGPTTRDRVVHFDIPGTGDIRRYERYYAAGGSGRQRNGARATGEAVGAARQSIAPAHYNGTWLGRLLKGDGNVAGGLCHERRSQEYQTRAERQQPTKGEMGGHLRRILGLVKVVAVRGNW